MSELVRAIEVQRQVPAELQGGLVHNRKLLEVLLFCSQTLQARFVDF